MKFNELEIHPDLIQAAADMGFEELMPVQEECLIPALSGRDIAGISQTGTGKTVAFLLPILHRIYTEELQPPTALIVAPTRELCIQIAEEAHRFSSNHNIRVCTIYGGEGYDRQERELAENPEIIAATPGRLIDYMKQGKIKLDTLRFLVLDEADRMFDMGFIRDIRFIMRKMPEDIQTMLFSATLSYYVIRLAGDFMNEPEEIRISSDTVAIDKIDQQLYHLGRDEKLNYLLNLLLGPEDVRAIVFTNLKSLIPFLVNSLRQFGFAATGISSQLDQKRRIRLLKDFKLGKYNVLVATDVASRGLDVDDVTHVFNYDMPLDSETYVHRIGRTARAGKSGISISFCSEADYEALPRIERFLGERIPVKPINEAYLEPPRGEYSPFADGTQFRTRSDDRHEDRDRSRRSRRGGGRETSAARSGGEGRSGGRTRERHGGRRESQEKRRRTVKMGKKRDDEDVSSAATVRDQDRAALLGRMAASEERSIGERKRSSGRKSTESRKKEGRGAPGSARRRGGGGSGDQRRQRQRREGTASGAQGSRARATGRSRSTRGERPPVKKGLLDKVKSLFKKKKQS